MPRSGEAGAGRSKPAESSAQPPPPAAATHAAGRKEGPPATNRFLLPASAGTLRTARARGSGRWARREAGSAQQRSGPAGPSGAGGARGRNTRAAPGAASPPPPRRPSAERPQPLPRGGPSRAANGSRQPRSHPSPRSGRPSARPPPFPSFFSSPPPTRPPRCPLTPLRTGAARRLPPPRGAVASSRPTCPPARPLLRRSLLGLRRGGHFELPNSFAAAGETRGRGARAPGPPGGVGDGGVAAAGSEPRARGGLRTAGTAFCPGARGRRWRAKRRERYGCAAATASLAVVKTTWRGKRGLGRTLIILFLVCPPAPPEDE